MRDSTVVLLLAMCLIAFAVDAHPRYRLVVTANRDEFHGRPTAAAHHWSGGLLAGRDLEAGGTWLGVAPGARFAAVTNYRQGTAEAGTGPSRGELVPAFCGSSLQAPAWAAAFDGTAYSGFNLLLDDGSTMLHLSNRGGEPAVVQPGVHGLSNHLLDTPWPKVVSARTDLEALIADGDEISTDSLLALLESTHEAEDRLLPRTGIPIEWERRLSASRIVGPAYGTRSTTAVLVDRNGSVTFAERSYDPAGSVSHAVCLRIPAE